MLFLEQVPEELRLRLSVGQVAADPGHKFSAIGGATFVEAIGFDVLVEEFIGVELLVVTRQPVEVRLGLVGGDEIAGHDRTMHRAAIHDQMQLPCRLREQATRELHEQSAIELAVEYHQRKMATVCDRRDNVAAKAQHGGSDDRRVAHQSIARTGDVVAAKAHLVPSVNDSFVPLRVPGDRRILRAQSARNCRTVTFIGPGRRLLRVHAPASQVATDRAQRHRNAVLALDQTHHCRPRPQIERQLQIARQRVDGQLPDAPAAGGLRPPAPRAFCFSARSPPARSSAIHLLIARRLTLNTLDASVCLMPPRTACTTVLRKCICIVISNLRASGLFLMPESIEHYALFDARISNSRGRYMKVFVTFASSSWHKARSRIVRQAQKLGVFDAVYGYDEADLVASFRERYRDKLVNGSRGFGYWCWKPQVILQALDEMSEGDILQYTDAGCHLNSAGKARLDEYFEIAARTASGVLAFQATTPTYPLPDLPCEPLDLIENRWVKGDLLDHLGVRQDSSIVQTPTIGATVILIRNCDASRRLIQKWAAVVDEDFHLIDDTPSISPNFPEFVEHRHDQSIFSLLCKMYGVETLSAYEYWFPGRDGVTPDWGVLKKYPIHARRDRGFWPKKVASKFKRLGREMLRRR